MGHSGERPLLLALLILAVCQGRIVKIPTRDLVRVEGTELVIPCNVSDYDGPSEQNFDWSFSSSGTRFVEIVSTWEAAFTAQPYRERLQRGEIQLRRIGNDAVELHVKNLQTTDQGQYKCSTPSTDATVQGNYDDTVQVRVLADALQVSSKSQPASSLRLRDGDSFELHCSASSASLEHTHLSVTWELHRGPARQKILSLTHENRFYPGPQYESRYQSGDLRLDTSGEDVYRLSVSRVLPVDQGTYKCVVSEWIGEKGKWQEIQEKSVDVATVTIQPIEPLFDVLLNASKVPEYLDDPTELECQITDVRNTDANVRFTVSWYYRMDLRSDEVVTDELLAAMDGDWTLRFGERSRQRVQNGEIIFFKEDRARFIFRIQRTSEGDRGNYYCVVSAWTRQRNKSWLKSKEVVSKPVNIFWISEDSVLLVKARKAKPFFAAGNTFEMTCKVSSEHIKTPRYSVLVTAEKPAADPFSPNETKSIISLDQDSVVKLENWTDEARADGVVLEKVQEDEFRYRMYQTQVSDAGLYRCVVTAWSPVGGNLWKEAGTSLSNPIQIDFQTTGPIFNVSVHSDTPTVYRGDLIKLFCIISLEGAALDPDDMSFDVSWFAVHSFAMDKPAVLLSSLDRKGVVNKARRTWKSDLSLEKISVLEFLLQVHGSEDQDFGNYFCAVIPWIKSTTGSWQRETEIRSKPIFVTVKMDVLNAFKYPLLIGVSLSTIIGLISCLIGYCSSHWCCKKEVQETRRERRRLMSMEMD
ncbi:prostaglandin F2 receptor negative regulator isoform X3 [Macrotis lagotis]|uniref:prostaglandin F2 receptor negative regulator isoform X3 n=1 Tax=Macrotis lagotis TaxID=92651 RepID=UPI003D68DBD1